MLTTVLTFILTLLTSASAFADANQVKDYGFGLTPDEMIAQGYRSVTKSSGNEIYEKTTKYGYKKIVSLKNVHVSTVYKDDSGTYFQHTKLDEKGNVLGLAECKYQKDMKSTTCDLQTAEICHELLHKVDNGSYGFDLKKIQECADLSSKISYNRKSIDAFLPYVQKKLTALYPAAQSTVIKAPAVSLQTLIKDYAACKKVENRLVKPDAGSAPVTNKTTEAQGRQ